MQFKYSQDLQEEEICTQKCHQCYHLNSILPVKIIMSLYKKQLIPYLQYKLVRIIQNTSSRYKNPHNILFKDVKIFTQKKGILIKYNTFLETSQVIKGIILTRAKQELVKSVKFQKKIHDILLKHLTKKRQMIKSKQTNISSKSNYYISGIQNRNSNKQILKEFNVNDRFDFKPVSILQSKDSSTIMIQKLMRQLSIMIQKVQTKDQNFPEINDKMFQYFDIKVPKEEIMFKKHLSNNFSQISEQKKFKHASSVRLMTSPPQPILKGSKFEQAYGFQFQNYMKINKPKKKKSKSLIRKQANQKSLTRITPNIYLKQNFRMNTNQDSTRISNSRSKSNTRLQSKSKLLHSGKLLDKTKKSQKSVNKSRKVLRTRI